MLLRLDVMGTMAAALVVADLRSLDAMGGSSSRNQDGRLGLDNQFPAVCERPSLGSKCVPEAFCPVGQTRGLR
jgi:hypothetical protein